MENSSSGSPAENAQGLAGIRSAFAEIGGSVKTGLSRISSNKAVHGISKLDSTFFPFRKESEGEEFEEEDFGDFEEEEESQKEKYLLNVEISGASKLDPRWLQKSNKTQQLTIRKEI